MSKRPRVQLLLAYRLAHGIAARLTGSLERAAAEGREKREQLQESREEGDGAGRRAGQGPRLGARALTAPRGGARAAAEHAAAVGSFDGAAGHAWRRR